MNLEHTPYNYDSRPTQPREPSQAEHNEWAANVRMRCERDAEKAMRSDWADYVIDSTEADISEILDACEAVMTWRKDGCRIDERPEAECFMFVSLLLDRAENELYKILL